jgi:4-azaleucine resistance transporter AzlC
VSSKQAILFSRAGFVAGARGMLPLNAGVFAVGLVFGVLARQAGLHLIEAVLMSALAFGGAAQFIALGLWTAPLPIETIIVTTLIVNLRHLLMGAAMRPWFATLAPWKTYTSMFVMTDESWALSMRELFAGSRDAAFLLGAGSTLWIAWQIATVAGYFAGGAIQDPAAWGLDFAFVAAFTALLVGMWRGRSDVLPWGVAAVVAVAGSHLLPGKWYILLGALAGSLVGAFYDPH